MVEGRDEKKNGIMTEFVGIIETRGYKYRQHDRKDFRKIKLGQFNSLDHHLLKSVDIKRKYYVFKTFLLFDIQYVIEIN